MREFKDEEGRPWRLALTVGAALRCRDMVTVEVPELDEEGSPTGSRKTVPFDIVDLGTIAQTFQVLRGQFSKLGEILYALLVKQCEERKMSRDEFLDGLRGDSLEAAARALEEELVDFFPLRLRKTLALLAAKMTEATDELMAQAEEGLEKLTPADLPGTQSGKPPASSAPTPASGRSGSSSRRGTPASSTTGGTPPI